MTVCPECGHNNMSGLAFCDECGYDLSGVSAQPAAVVSPAVTLQATPGPAPIPPAADPFGDPFGDPFATSPAPDATVKDPPPSVVGDDSPVSAATGGPLQPLDPASAPVSPLPMPSPGAQPASTPAGTASLIIERNGQVGLAFAVTDPTLIGKWDMDGGNFPEIDATDHDSGGYISRRHALIEQRSGQWTVTDLGSTNGTALNRQKLAPQQPTPLTSGDELIVGRLFLRFQS